jgi:ammonia channel protein AmtB
MVMQEILSAVDAELFGVWFLIGAALVFWMQAGFAMVETGFTRAKNSGNIIMKNLMDFCIGTVMFVLIGFSFLLGEDLLGFIGKPGFDIFTAYKDFNLIAGNRVDQVLYLIKQNAKKACRQFFQTAYTPLCTSLFNSCC